MSTGGSPARRAPVSGRPTPYIRSSEHADRRTSRRKPRSRTSCSRRATRSSRDGWDPHSTARLPTTSMLEPPASSSLTHYPMVRPSRYTSPAPAMRRLVLFTVIQRSPAMRCPHATAPCGPASSSRSPSSRASPVGAWSSPTPPSPPSAPIAATSGPAGKGRATITASLRPAIGS